MEQSWVVRIGLAWMRYGPGRLPGADRRNLGAGYACASAALLSAAAFACLALAASALPGGGENNAFGIGLLAAAATPFVVPSAFVLGWFAWRYLPAGTPFFGPVAGALTALLTYPVASVLVSVALVVGPGDTGWVSLEGTLVGSLTVGLFFGTVALFLTFWLTLPLGAAAGYLYERARETTVSPAEAPESAP